MLQNLPQGDLINIQDVLNGIPHGMAIFDRHLNLVNYNDKFESLLNLPKSYLETPRKFKDILYINWDRQEKKDKNNFSAKFLSELAKANTSDDLFPLSYEYKIEGGKHLEIKGDVISEVGIVITYSDITARRETEKYLKKSPLSEIESDHLIDMDESRQLLETQASDALEMAENLAIAQQEAEDATHHIQAILNTMSDGLVTLDTKGNILMSNRTTEDMFGYTIEELKGRNIAFLLNSSSFSPEMGMADFLETMKLNRRGYRRKDKGKRKDGSSFPIELNVREVIIGGNVQFTTVIQDGTERHKAEAMIRRMAMHDSLTGLANRNLLQSRLDEALKLAKRMNKKVSVMFLDLDMFKPVNDMFGHATGDKLLRVVAQRLEKCARDIDTVARLGGDEFAIVFTSLDDENSVTNIAQRILESIKKPVHIDGVSHMIGTSIGISFFPHDSERPDELIRMADVALYQAKDGGRNIYRLYDQNMDAAAKKEKQIELDLEKAIRKEEFILHYQPQVDSIDNSVIGVEALIRWNHPEKGMIPPFSFIQIAENSGKIIPMGNWILETACIQARKWQDKGLQKFRMCVNISARQFQSQDFLSNVKNALKISKLDPRWLELEITEGMVIDETETVVNKLELLSALGVTLAIDDFGTGYSSLAYLKRFSVHQLKIDQSFIRDIADDHDDAAITDAVIRLGHSLGLSVVAEGVETEEQVQILRQKGCDVLQGYYFSKPVAADQLEQWLTKHREES